MPRSIVKHLCILDTHVRLPGTSRLNVQGSFGSAEHASLATTTNTLSICLQKLYTGM